MQETFYMVVGAGPTNVRHPSREAAEREAKRLARGNPGVTFFVTMAIDGFVKDEVRRVELHPADVDLPF